MQLMTKELEKQFKKVGSQEDVKDPIVLAKFFNSSGNGHWWAISYDEINKIFYGYAQIFYDDCDEWGSFSLDELQNFRGRFGLGIERDLHFQPKPISEVVPKAILNII